MTFRRVTDQECRELAAVMREADVRECWDVGGLRPLDALKKSYRNSAICRAVYMDGAPMCIYGIGRSQSIGVGHPWLLGSELIAKAPVRFLRGSLAILRELETDYAALVNIADERNEVHLRWLEWLGFKFTHRYPEVGPGRVPVLLFAKVNSCVSLPFPQSAQA